MPLKNITNLTNLTLIVALALSAVAAYYSIIGLTAIFAGAVIPVIIMGSILEIGKITTTVWLRKYWHQCSWVLKLYLVPAVIALAILTSMGIFGFLSKAHMDSGVTSGDVQAKLALYDEKIKTQRDNIEVARKALQQMDAQVDARLSRGDSEAGAERAVQIRRQQASERTKLQKEIGDAQKEIAKLNEERAPIAAENRKVEAEVGPIKYVAALIYGDNPDSNLLERAVRWVIILLVIVFDPLAIALVLAANSSKEWDEENESNKPDAWVADVGEKPTLEELEPELEPDDNQLKKTEDSIAMNIAPEHPNVETRPFTQEEIKALDEPLINSNTHPYLNQGFKYPEGWEFHPPMVYNPESEKVSEDTTPDENLEKNIAHKLEVIHKLHSPIETVVEKTPEPNLIVTEGVTKEKPYEDLDDGWVKHNGNTLQKDALRRLKPELFAVPDNVNEIKTGFGTSFPEIAGRGDIFVRVDVLPNRVFKFDGTKWLEMQKNNSSSYLDNKSYIQFLINKIYTGEYDLDSLSDDERTQIESFLENQKS